MELLELTLRSLERQSFPAEDFEVVLVDDGSTDGTAAGVRGMALSFEHQLIRLERNGGRAMARNQGIRAASGDLLVTTDDDHLFPPSFLAAHAAKHTGREDLVVLGSLRPRELFTHYYPAFTPGQQKLLNRSFARNVVLRQRFSRRVRGTGRPVDAAVRLIDPDEVGNYLLLQNLAIPNSQGEWEAILSVFGSELSGFFCPWALFGTGNSSMRRAAAMEIGLFDEEMNGWGLIDIEFGYRLHKAGLRFDFTEATGALHQVHPVNHGQRMQSRLHNYAVFCRKHPGVEGYLYWKKWPREWGLRRYAEVIREYRDLVDNHPQLANLRWAFEELARDFNRRVLQPPSGSGYLPSSRSTTSQRRGSS